MLKLFGIFNNHSSHCFANSVFYNLTINFIKTFYSYKKSLSQFLSSMTPKLCYDRRIRKNSFGLLMQNSKKLIFTCSNRHITYHSLVLWRSSIRDANGHIMIKYPSLPDSYFKFVQPFPVSNGFDGWPYLRRVSVLRYYFLKGLLEIYHNLHYFSFSKWLSELHSILHPHLSGKTSCISFRTYVSSPTGHHSVLMGPISDSNVVKNSNFSDFLANSSQAIYTTFLPNIPFEFLPYDTFTDSTITHFYPHHSSLPYYIDAASSQLVLFINCYFSGNTSKNLLLNYAFSFFHYLSSARLFGRGNHSLYMNLLNTMLDLIGLPKLQHGCIDFAAIHFDFSTFQEYMFSIKDEEIRIALSA